MRLNKQIWHNANRTQDERMCHSAWWSIETCTLLPIITPRGTNDYVYSGINKSCMIKILKKWSTLPSHPSLLIPFPISYSYNDLNPPLFIILYGTKKLLYWSMTNNYVCYYWSLFLVLQICLPLRLILGLHVHSLGVITKPPRWDISKWKMHEITANSISGTS